MHSSIYVFSMPTLITQWGWVWRYHVGHYCRGRQLPTNYYRAGMFTLILIAFLSAKARQGFAPAVINTMQQSCNAGPLLIANVNAPAPHPLFA